MLKEYRFEKFVNIVTSKYSSLTDTKKYYRLNEHWVNAVVWQLLYDRAISKGYNLIKNDTKHCIHKNGKYYKDEEFEKILVLSK